MLSEQLARAHLLLGEDPLDLLVHEASSGIRVLAAAGHEVLTEENLLLTVPGHRADLLAHAPLTDHAAGQTGDDLEIVGGSGRLLREHELLGDTTADGAVTITLAGGF